MPLLDKVAKPLNFNETVVNNHEAAVVDYNDNNEDGFVRETNVDTSSRSPKTTQESFVGEHYLPQATQERLIRGISSMETTQPLVRRPISREENNVSNNNNFLNRSMTDDYHDEPPVDVNDDSLLPTKIYNRSQIVDDVNDRNFLDNARPVSKASIFKNLVDSSTSPDDETFDGGLNGLDAQTAKIICQRTDYFTVPSLEVLSESVDEDGRCIVDGFTVGRTNYGSIFWPETINVANLDLDHIGK